MYKRKSHELIVDCLTWNYLNRASVMKLYLEGPALSCLNSSVTRKTDEDNIPHQCLRTRIPQPDW